MFAQTIAATAAFANATTTMPFPEVSLLNCKAANWTGVHPVEPEILAEIIGTSCSLVAQVAFLTIVVVSRVCPSCYGMYHWLSLDHVISLALLTMLQSLSYLMSAMSPGFASIYLPSDVCYAQAIIRTFADVAVLSECAVIPFLAYQVICRQIPFTVIKAKYGLGSFLFVYGFAAVLTAVPALVGQSYGLVVFAPNANSGTCTWSTQCLIFELAGFFSFLVIFCVVTVYFSVRRRRNS